MRRTIFGGTQSNPMSVTGKRDVQRQKAYRAEWSMKGAGHEGRVFPTAMHVEAYVRRLAQSKWFVAKFGRHYFRMESATGRSSTATPGRSYHTLAIHSRMRNQLTIAHEIAHCVRPLKAWPTEKGAWHGPEFAATLLVLVQHTMGTKAAQALRAHYRTQKVRYKKPRTMSPEQRAALAARLAQYRRPMQRAASPELPDDHFVTFGGDY